MSKQTVKKMKDTIVRMCKPSDDPEVNQELGTFRGFIVTTVLLVTGAVLIGVGHPIIGVGCFVVGYFAIENL